MYIQIRLLLVLLIFTLPSKAQTLIPSEILQKVFLIKYGNNIGTCFLISVDSCDYLITAKHIFPNSLLFKSPVDIEIFHNSGWMKFKPNLLFHTNLNIDIAVLDLKSNDVKQVAFDIGSDNFYLSEECFFLGFPFGLRMDDTKEGSMNKGFPLPFVKRAIISSFVSDSTKMRQIFLDGHNNPGFSGGPVVIANLGKDNKHKMRVIGIISAYLNEDKVIKTPYGDLINKENSGIVVSYAFNHVFEIIKRK